MRRPPEYLAPYVRAIADHGPGFCSLLFTSRELQQRRFAVLTSTIAFAGRRVADLGSGHADLLHWLDTHGPDYAHFVAVEAVADFVEVAQQQTADHGRISFVTADFVADVELFSRLVLEHEVDTMVFCGSLNTLDDGLALRVLDRAWHALARQPGAVLAFNFLAGGGGDWKRPPTNLPRRDVGKWCAWAHQRSSQLVFCQHYLGAHDATLVMYRT